MKFRPCIDIHNGRVKQIVGGSLRDAGDRARDNFVSEQDAAYYADLYRSDGLTGGHVILLNSADSPYYKEDLLQAQAALAAFPGGLMIGGGINDENAGTFLRMGASHVIVTSFVFRDGRLDMEALRRMVTAVGREHLVLDLSCRKKRRFMSKVSLSVMSEENAPVSENMKAIVENVDGPGKERKSAAGAKDKETDDYFIVTDRWQKFTDVAVTPELLTELSAFCGEYLIHAVDVEGRQAGIEENLAGMLGGWDGIPVTYAGGIHSMEDIRKIGKYGKDRLDFTVGSALDLFGGTLRYRDLRQLQSFEFMPGEVSHV